MTKEEFVKTYYSLAEKAGKKYNLNPTVILAQAAHESGWGGSYAARVRKNFFGILAAGKPNEYWDGSKSPSQTNPHLVFRIYKTAQDSFMDFARLISVKSKIAFMRAPVPCADGVTAFKAWLASTVKLSAHDAYIMSLLLMS